MRISLAICLLAVLSTSAIASTVSSCLVSADGVAVYNLYDFTQKTTFSASNGTMGSMVSFSFCSPQIPPCETGKSIYAVYNNTQAHPFDCEDVGSSANPSYHVMDPANPGNGVSAVFNPYPGNDTETFVLNITVSCALSQTNTTATNWTLVDYRFNGTHYLNITGASSHGCAAFTLGEFFNFLSQYKLIFVCVFFIFGLFISLFGLKMFNVTIFLVTATVGTFISGTLFYELVKFNSTGAVLWVVFGTCVFVGCVMGYLAVKYEKAGFFALGFALGVITALILYQGVLAPFLSSHGQAIFYIFLILMGLIGGGLGLWIWKDIVIIATSLIGSYMAVRSLSVYIGGFPPEGEIAAGLVQLTIGVYAYIIVIVLLAIGAMFFQFRNKKIEEDEKEEANPQNIYKNMMDTGY